MNYFELEISKYERRLKKIRENPDPSKSKCNEMLYEMELDLARHKLDAWKEGRPFADGVFEPIFRAMGFEYLDLSYSADRSQLAAAHFDIVRSAGFNESACDRTIVGLAMVINKDLPVPSLIAVSNYACDPLMAEFNAVARWFDVPVFTLDISIERNNETLVYLAEQYRQLTEFAESRFPGIKYDEKKLVELQEADRIAIECGAEVYELRKRIPCVIAGKDAFRLTRLPSAYPDIWQAVEYFRAWRDEMKQRADSGQAALAEEKMRVLWAVSGPFHTDPFSLLEKRGVAVPWFHYDMASRWSGGKFGNYGDEKEYGRKLTPLEEEARIHNYLTWAGKGERWVNDTLSICEDLKVDAIINFLQVGCTATASIGKLLADAAQERLGIRTLHIEGRQLDPAYFDQTAMYRQLNDFIDICLAGKQTKERK